jgi:hypothetical protein
LSGNREQYSLQTAIGTKSNFALNCPNIVSIESDTERAILGTGAVMKLKTIKALAIAATLLSTGGASAATLNLGLGTGWNVFAFKGAGQSAYNKYSFTVAADAILTLVDGYLSGDRFQVFVDNVSRGLSSLPVNGGAKLGRKWDQALADPNFSKRTLYFTPGTYTLSMLVVSRSAGADQGALRLDTAVVPVPAGGLLLVSALGAAAVLRRRRKQAL